MQTPERIRSDFDRIALLPGASASHNDYYHSYLLRHLPARCERALEIGCGTGAFSRILASRAGQVTALDIAPEMIRLARERSQRYGNIDYRATEVMEWGFSVEEFDCVVSIATLHHLPLDTMLQRMRDTLRPGGVIAVLDLCRDDGIADRLRSLIAVPLNLGLRLVATHRLRQSPQELAAWTAHGRYDRYPTVREVRSICRRVLPGARVKRHLLWRYSLVWEKPRC